MQKLQFKRQLHLKQTDALGSPEMEKDFGYSKHL